MLKETMKAIPLAAAVSAAMLFGSSAIAGGSGDCMTDAKAPHASPMVSKSVPAGAVIVAQDTTVSKDEEKDKPKEDKPPKEDKVK